MSALIRLYPAAWRARYGAEFEDLLNERPPSGRDLLDIVVAAVDAHVSPQVVGGPAGRVVARTDRLAGVAAVAGGLTFSGALLAALLRDADVSAPILVAFGLMLLSLPGRYLRPYAGRVLLAVLAVTLSIATWLDGTHFWNSVVAPISMLTVLGAIGPGALALAVTRAGIKAKHRWLVVLTTMPAPFVIAIASMMGFMDGPLQPVIVLVSMLPIGLAWTVAGWRIAQGRRTEQPSEPPSMSSSSNRSNATTGGSA